MRLLQYIDWPEKIKKFGLVPDGYAPDDIGMVPVFKIVPADPARYPGLTLVKCSFLDQALDGVPVGWIIKKGREYSILTNYSYFEPYTRLMTHDRKGKPLYMQSARDAAVQYGPFKSLHTAVKMLRGLLA